MNFVQVAIPSPLRQTFTYKNQFSSNLVGKRVLVEFVSANPTGPLTVGHGRGAMLGDTVSNIMEWNGYNVEIPSNQTCCGALHAHSGDSKMTNSLASENNKELLNNNLINQKDKYVPPDGHYNHSSSSQSFH